MASSYQLPLWQIQGEFSDVNKTLPDPPSHLNALENDNDIETKVLLLNILHLLQNMSLRLEAQDTRLSSLETPYVHPRAQWQEYDASQEAEPWLERSLSNHYEHSLLKTKTKWSSKSDASSIDLPKDKVGPISKGKMVEICDSNSIYLDKPHASAYSLSAYTEDLLDMKANTAPPRSFTEMVLPPVSPVTLINKNQSSEDHRVDPVTTSNIPHSQETVSRLSSKLSLGSTSGRSRRSRLGSIHSWKTTSSSRSSTGSSHATAELSFHAYDTWKHGVVSKLKNESGAARRVEEKRLRLLRPSQESDNAWGRLISLVRRVVRANVEESVLSPRSLLGDARAAVIC